MSTLPRSITRTLFALALVALAAAWLLTHSELVQLLVLLAISYVPRAVAARRAAGADTHANPTEGLSAPWPVVLLSCVLVLPVGIAIFFLSGAVDLGLFWLFALLWPWLEIFETLVRRDIERHGTSNWKPERPVRGAAISVAATTVAMAALALLDGAGMLEAFLIGVSCGLIVLVIGLGSRWLHRGPRSAE